VIGAFPWASSTGRPRLALVALSVVERRLDAVRAVLAGASVTEVAASLGVSRQSVHDWVGRYLAVGAAEGEPDPDAAAAAGVEAAEAARRGMGGSNGSPDALPPMLRGGRPAASVAVRATLAGNIVRSRVARG
jgi:transposase-like protein